MRFQPFEIIHIDTSTEMPVAELIDKFKGNKYVVVWWKNYPLCHQFFEAQHPEKNVLLKQLYDGFLPALSQYYKLNHEQFENDLKSVWLSQQQNKWNLLLQAVLFTTNQEFSADEVSIIVCTRNRAALLKNCLELLQKQQHPPKEIIVVDNAPDDDATKKTVSQFSNVIYCLEEKKGLDFARNAGAKAATGNIIAYTDDDAILHPLWTYYIRQAFSEPCIMAVTGLIIAAELKHEAQVIFEKYWSFNRGYVFKKYDKSYFDKHVLEGVPAWEIGAGANMAFRKEIFELTGYFDERLDVGAAGCNGDSEYWYRILASGYSIQYTPLAIAYHLHRKNMRSLKKQIFYYMRGFTAALHIQQERFGDKGNLFHLHKIVLPYYLKILPKAIRYRFKNNYSTYFHEIAGIFSGIRFYKKNKNKIAGK